VKEAEFVAPEKSTRTYANAGTVNSDGDEVATVGRTDYRATIGSVPPPFEIRSPPPREGPHVDLVFARPVSEPATVRDSRGMSSSKRLATSAEEFVLPTGVMRMPAGCR
jgi:hypothetical protein